MIDTHSHLYEPEFDADRDMAVARAKDAGVTKILLPNINLHTIEPMLHLCGKYPDYCYPMMGLHPEDVKADWEQILEEMHQLLVAPQSPYVAVGEIGLDFYWDQTYRQQQLEAFETQLCWARDLHLPVVIHSRNAHEELVEVMSSHKNEDIKGVFHCFGGTLEEAQELLQFEGFALGIGGVLTFKKSVLPDVVRAVPLERLVLETDCPYLAPVPHRGTRNESAYVADVLSCLARTLELPEDRVDEITSDTVKRLFPRAYK